MVSVEYYVLVFPLLSLVGLRELWVVVVGLRSVGAMVRSLVRALLIGRLGVGAAVRRGR